MNKSTNCVIYKHVYYNILTVYISQDYTNSTLVTSSLNEYCAYPELDLFFFYQCSVGMPQLTLKYTEG